MSDWGTQSPIFDEIKTLVGHKDLSIESEAQTRFDVIDRIIQNVLGWKNGQISVEERQGGGQKGYLDYTLRAGDITIIIEAKKIGASFPTPTNSKTLKLNGVILSQGEISGAIEQVLKYSKTKPAQIVVVTNGRCWCFFDILKKNIEEDKQAYLLFPFDVPGDAEELFKIFSEQSISKNQLANFLDIIPVLPERKILSTVRDAELRMDRNRIADFISPALNHALHADSILNDANHLKNCFVSTESRIKFDNVLGMHLVDTRPVSVSHVKRIKPSRQHGPFENIIIESEPSFAPPVTLLLAPVGSGKSTYLKHFELVTGAKILENKKALWIYIDFEAMGQGGNPRDYLYKQLKKYLSENSTSKGTDYKNAIEPAYQEEITGLKNGPLAPISDDIAEVNKQVSELISRDYESVEPYVDKVLGYLSKKRLCVVVLDNIDLYEDEKLETSVFSEGLALSKRVFCNVMVSLRDTTYMKHKNDSIFDAYQLRTFWLDAPPFREVLSRRLAFSKILLKGRGAVIQLKKGARVIVPDLSLFFQIVQSSILRGDAGIFIENMASVNIRKGLKLVTNFLTSGHISAERAMKVYLASHSYIFPFHEIFKGSILGPWMYYKESRCECLNIFDSGLSSKNLRLLRFLVLSYLFLNSKSQKSIHVNVEKCIEIFSHLGANEPQIIGVLHDLAKADLIKDNEAKIITHNSTVYITRTGGYTFKLLAGKMVYVESCLYDTFIDDELAWKRISELSFRIEHETQILPKFDLRKKRLKIFTDHLKNIERSSLSLIPHSENLACMDEMIKALERDVVYAEQSAKEFLHSLKRNN